MIEHAGAAIVADQRDRDLRDAAVGGRRRRMGVRRKESGGKA